jgi:large subunit ribosomal protein L1
MATKKKTEEEVIEETPVVEEAAEEVTEVEDVVEDTDEETEAENEEKFTKAGKHSKKAVTEAEEEEARKAKAAEAKDEEPVKVEKIAVVHVPNMKKRHGKGYVASLAKVDRNIRYNLEDAVKLAQETSAVKFDASLEMHVNLGVDPRQADQMVRATVVLPHGTGKSLRIAVVGDDAAVAAAKKAGADIVGGDELIAKMEKGQLDFDKLIATPSFMPKLGKLAKVLGPKGLMPNPKSGSVTDDVETAVTEAKAGKVEFRIDKQAIVHQAIGKVSFDTPKLLENAMVFVSAIMKAKPSAAKGTYIKALSLTTSMGPGIKLDVSQAIKDATQK